MSDIYVTKQVKVPASDMMRVIRNDFNIHTDAGPLYRPIHYSSNQDRYIRFLLDRLDATEALLSKKARAKLGASLARSEPVEISVPTDNEYNPVTDTHPVAKAS